MDSISNLCVVLIQLKALLTILLCLPIIGSAQLSPEQERQVDSLKQVISSTKHDTTIVNALMAWDNIIYASDPKLDFELNLEIDSLCNTNLKKELNEQEKASFLKVNGNALSNIGIIYYRRGDYEVAIEYFYKCLQIFEEIGNKKGISTTFNNLGNIHYVQGDYQKAIEYYSKSLKIKEEIGNKHGVAGSLSNIGIIYYLQGDYQKALEYYSKSIKIKEEIDDKYGIGETLNNIGTIYNNQGTIKKQLSIIQKV